MSCQQGRRRGGKVFAAFGAQKRCGVDERAVGECWRAAAAGKIAFGVSDTLQCLEMGAVETLIVWENLEARPACGLDSRRVPSFRWGPAIVNFCSAECASMPRSVVRSASYGVYTAHKQAPLGEAHAQLSHHVRDR